MPVTRRQTLKREGKMKLHTYVTLSIVAFVLSVGVSNGQVKQKISEDQLTDLLSRIDGTTEGFTKTADKALDKSGYDGSKREDDLNRILKDFKSATAGLKNDHVGENGKAHFGVVLHHGLSVESWFKKYPLDGVQEEWATLRSELGELTSGFNITWKEGEGYAQGTPVGEVDVKNLCMHIEDVADRYKEALDKALDNSKLNHTKTEDEINRYVKDFRNATNRLQDHYNGDGAKDDAKEVLTKANKIDGFMHKHTDAIPQDVQESWGVVRADLDRLAKFYNVSWRWQQ
jgi:uncharacterized protein YukE